MKVSISLTSGTHLHNRIISIRGEVCAYRTNLTPALFVEVPVTNLYNGPASRYMCVIWVSILRGFSVILLMLELFWQWAFLYSFYFCTVHQQYFRILSYCLFVFLSVGDCIVCSSVGDCIVCSSSIYAYYYLDSIWSIYLFAK